MIYTFVITVPAKTSLDAPLTQRITVKGEILTQVSLLIPPGHMALAGLQIYYGDKQLIPANEGSWLMGDGESISWPEYIELPEPETTLIVKAYNDDEVYSHTFYLRIITTYRKYMMPSETMSRVYKLFEWLLSRLRGRV